MLSRIEYSMAKIARKRFFIVALIIVLLDQGTKFFLSKFIPVGNSVNLIPGFLNLVHIKNSGVAFGLFATHSSWARYLFSSINLVAVIVLFFVAQKSSPFLASCFGLIAGGAVGNFIDRFFQGMVLDFIDLHLGSYHWPAFNLADSAITVGVLIIAIFSLHKEK